MKEEKIEQILFRFEKAMGPMARHLAMEIAEKKKIIKENKISPSDQQEYTSFLTEFTIECSKIAGRDMVERLLEEIEKEE